MNKQDIVRFLRQTHLLSTFDNLKFMLDVVSNSSANAGFRKQYPGFMLPPKFLAYDAYASINADMYYQSGQKLAQYFAGHIKQHCGDVKQLKIYEWGCGPARIIRHLSGLFSEQDVRIFGSDYNKATINWCQQAIPDITFILNDLEPPVSFPDDSFDAIYNYSVFTHLSESSHFQWMNELRRLLKPGGILIMTTHGDISRSHLLKSEEKDYDLGRLVVRGKIMEGKRCYVAYHSPRFVSEKMLKGFQIVEHINSPSACYPQDVWVARKVG